MINKIQNYIDYSLFGTNTTNGVLDVLYGKDALANSILLWLSSNKGDYIRRPDKGGYVIPFLSKPMTDRNISDLKRAIYNGLTDDYDSTLSIQSLQVTPDYQNSEYIINLSAYSMTIKDVVEIETVLKNLS